MKRIGKKVAILLAVMALTGGYVHTASITVQVTAASPEELQKSAWRKVLANNAGALTEEEKASLNQVFNNIIAWGTAPKFLKDNPDALNQTVTKVNSWDKYIRLYSTYTQVIGENNKAVNSDTDNSGRAVYGGNHQYVSDAAATLGHQGNNFGTNSVVVGYQPSAFGENSIAMGTGSTAFPIKYGENFAGYANAIGADAWAGDMGNAFGTGAVAMGQGSVAIGTMAMAGSPDIQKYISRGKYEYQPYFEQLQAAYPNIFGETQPNESVTARSERMGQQIFKEYSTYFKKIGINDFTTFKTRVSQWESVLQKFGWHMALSKDARHNVTALGFGATATATGGVALGAFSEADRAISEVIAPFSGVTLTAENTLGAVSVGNKTHGRQLINVADGTEDMDAVNLRQLKGLEKKVGTAGKDGKSAYEIWRDHTVDGQSPNKDKSEQEFLDSLKGKDGKDGTGADIDIQGNDTGIVVADKKTDTAGKTTYTLGLDKTIKAGTVVIDGTQHKEKASIGDVQINGEKGHGTVTGLSNTTWDEKHVISGRAATEDQLQAVSQKNRQAILELGTRSERGTASAAALAALHPQEFDPDDKWDFAVGYSNYRSANTFAFGGFYRPNERTLVSLGGTFGGENIVNVGLSFKTGKGADCIGMSRLAMAREIQALKEKDAAKDRIMQALLQVQQQKEAEIQALKEKDGQREEQIRHLTAMVMRLQK